MLRLRRWAQLLRTIIGVPDYERYVCHMRAHHADAPLLTPTEFCTARLNARYSRPGSRCC